jgi:fatty acid-binding protein DegV
MKDAVLTKEEVISLGMQLTFAIREYDMLADDATEEEITHHYDRIISLAVAFSIEAAHEWCKVNKEDAEDLTKAFNEIHNHIATTRPTSSRVH